MSIWSWLHIVVAYFAYIVIAILASIVIRRTVGDLKDFNARNSPRILLMGAAANLAAMVVVLLLLLFWDQQPITALGFAFQREDALAAFGGLLITFVLAIAFIEFLGRTKRLDVLEVRRRQSLLLRSPA